MRKIDELRRPDSCINKSRNDEMVFVLTGRDAAAPHAIRAWVDERLRLGKNAPGDPQIVEALECAAIMEVERAVRHVSDGQMGDPDWMSKIREKL